MSDAVTPDLIHPILIGDIGGTHARFQIIPRRGGKPLGFETAMVSDYPTIEAAIEATLADYDGERPNTAVLAAAGQADRHGVTMTNSHWRVDAQRVLAACGWEKFILLNDFEAQAMALPFLVRSDLEPVGSGELGDQRHCKAVIGPGTGLGAGLLVRAGGLWIPVPGEGGHIDLGPRTHRESRIWPHLEAIDGRISAEQCLSGDGLLNIYNAVCAVTGVEPALPTAAAISTSAMGEGDDPAAHEALNLFCTLLGRVAGDLALISMAHGGVYLGGGIAQKILPFLRSSPFRDAFEDKAPHSAWMQSVATFVITHELPALVGLTAYAHNPQDFAIDIADRSWERA